MEIRREFASHAPVVGGYSVKRIMGWQPGGGPGLGQAGQRGESYGGGFQRPL